MSEQIKQALIDGKHTSPDGTYVQISMDALMSIVGAPAGTTPGNPWQTVPLPATADMIAAGEALDKAMRDQGFANAEPDAIYMAMLDAAPPAPSAATSNDLPRINAAMTEIWSEWFQFYTNHFRGSGIAISMADQQAFYEIAQPKLMALARNQGQGGGPQS